MNEYKLLTQELIDRGIIVEGQRLDAESAISWGIRQKGLEGVVEKLKYRKKPISNAGAVLRMMLEDLPNCDPKPYNPPNIQMSIQEEIEQEERDKCTIEYLQKESSIMRPYFAMPEDLPHVQIAEYRENTWITVYNEAKANNTSMHEICRRKGLDYRSLIA